MLCGAVDGPHHACPPNQITLIVPKAARTVIRLMEDQGF